MGWPGHHFGGGFHQELLDGIISDRHCSRCSRFNLRFFFLLISACWTQRDALIMAIRCQSNLWSIFHQLIDGKLVTQIYMMSVLQIFGSRGSDSTPTSIYGFDSATTFPSPERYPWPTEIIELISNELIKSLIER